MGPQQGWPPPGWSTWGPGAPPPAWVPAPAPAPPRDGSGFGTAGALLGMAAVVLPCLSWLTVRLAAGPAAGVVALVLLLAGLPVAVLAVVLSAVGLSPRRAGRGAAATGLLLAGFVLAVWLLGLAVPLTRL